MKANYTVVNHTAGGKEKHHFSWATGDPICGAKIYNMGKLYERHAGSLVTCQRCLKIDKERSA
jgi:hypothetical protein